MPHRYRVLIVVSVATFVASMDLFIVNIAFPTIERDFAGTSDATLSWVLSAYAIVTAALLIPAGRLADLLGRKRLFMGGLVTFVVASALCAAAPGAGWLIGARITALFAGSVVLAAGFVYWSSRHPAPVLELGLFRARAFSAANISGTLFFAAFGAMLLSSVLFLTRVWHEDILTAGLQISPGPIAAAAFAVPGSLLSSRYGQRAMASIGALLFAVAGLWWLRTVGLQPHYASEFLPGWLIGGTGVGL